MESVLEVCAASLASVKAAAQGGAARIELCSALSEGGVTPSAGLISMARKVEGVKLHVLIRPRGGDFVYDAAETECMMADIRMAAECGADGVVIGALRCDGYEHNLSSGFRSVSGTGRSVGARHRFGMP